MASLPRPDDAFREGAFLVRDALAVGHGAGTFRHARWHRPFSGVRSREGLGLTLADRALQYLPRLAAGQHFSHATALALLGCPIRVPVDAPVDVSSPSHRAPVTCAGVVGHRHRPGSRQYACLLPDGEERVLVSSPLDAVLQSATQLPLSELVVALDHLVRNDPSRFDRFLKVGPRELAEFASQVTGRGVVRFRHAAALVRVGAESRMETLMRLCAVSAGMGELTLQADIRDAQGTWIGRFDAADLASRSLFEYDGEQHLFSAHQRRRDAVKHQQARDAGWRIFVCYARDVVDAPKHTGLRMREFAGQKPKRVPAELERLLGERAEGATESAIHVVRAWPEHVPR